MKYSNLIEKYDVPTPRYTSYPTVPYWQKNPPTQKEWLKHCKATFKKSNQNEGISLYIHLPFCEKLCTFCGCNKRITVNHDVEDPYIQAVLKEWDIYLDILQEPPSIKEIHLGGGTPTFFSAQNLEALINGLVGKAKTATDFEFSLEAHPNVITNEQLKVLYKLGFRRLSVGVQDFDPYIQKIINRFQTFEQTKKVLSGARDIGFDSINIDLIYGLPFQRKMHVEQTIHKTKELLPERIAFYSYAHVPWKSPGQRKFTEKDIPKGKEKRALYELGRTLLQETGYKEIGMDHFALPKDALYHALNNKTLHRNFMGYTSNHTSLMIGLGVSAISDSWTTFIQNKKTVEEYEKIVNNGELPVHAGHILSKEDQIIRKHILNLMCLFHTSWSDPELQHPNLFEGIKRMKKLEQDGLVVVKDDQIMVTQIGKPFIRNICMTLDSRLWSKKPATKIFSQAV